MLRAGDDKVAGTAKAQYAGKTDRGFLLPNGWTISPAGDQVTLTDLPLNIIPLADGRHALAASSGYNAHNLVLIDLATKAVVAKETVRQSWFGLAIDEKSGRVWWSGGGGNRLHTFTLKGETLTRTGEPEPAPQPRVRGQGQAKKAKRAESPRGRRTSAAG